MSYKDVCVDVMGVWYNSGLRGEGRRDRVAVVWG